MVAGLLSSSTGRGLSGNSTNNFHTNSTSRPDSLLADRWYQRRSETTARGFSVAVSPTLVNRTTSLGGKEYTVASFHSSPLSWFAAEAEEAKPTEDASTTEEAPAVPEESSPDDDANSDEEPSATDITYDLAPPAALSEASQDKVEAIFDKVKWLDMIEVHLLTQVVNEQMGISWKETEQRSMGGGGAVQKAASGGAEEVEEVEEKTIFDLKLMGFDAKKKIKVIKEVRTIAGLGLKEAKEMVEGAPKVIQKELKKEKAEELKAQLEAVGALVELV
jgi:large subunit ribosomal protein L7/L12